jgi:hypothetical protein
MRLIPSWEKGRVLKILKGKKHCQSPDDKAQLTYLNVPLLLDFYLQNIQLMFP